MTVKMTLIGFGEAGRTFAGASGWQSQVCVFDIKGVDPLTRAAMLSACHQAEVNCCENLSDALNQTSSVLSLVTADQCLAVAQNAAQHIAFGACYFDMNSVAPDTKREAAKVIAAAGGRYFDVAIMAPVDPAQMAVPLLISGPQADKGASVLRQLGFGNVRMVGSDIGRASSIKMIRSIMVKGQEALTAEMLLAADKAGVTDEVLASLGDGWVAKASYNLERMMTHGLRRAAEMEEVAKTLTALGVEPAMTSGTIMRQREMALQVGSGQRQ
jgi:3-hydroxyisobutyrate dehydrogenase-like beta-hydroxyacid dehydrogenase